MTRPLTLRPPAKINLSLDVGARQADGFHEVRTVLQAIGISDTLRLTPRRGPLTLSTRSPGVPADATNLVWRAAALLWREAGRPGEPRDVQIKLDKAIPTAAGLGGGSADAAAALAGLNTVWNLRWSRERLAKLGASLGSDVPYFFVGGTAIGLGRGDDVLPLQDIGRFGIVIITPSFGVSTADAYRWLDEDRAASATEPAREQSLRAGWAAGALRVTNDLQDPVARRHPVLTVAIDACRREGALVAGMTGSGSAVFGVFTEAGAARAARRLRRPEWLVILTRTLSRAESARRLGY